MSVEVKVPQLPESVADATLVAWHRKVGDAVRRDENLVDLETDKVVLEVPSPTNGTLKEIKVQDGATVQAGDVLAVVEAGDAPSAEDTAGEAPSADAAEAGEPAEAEAGAGEPADEAEEAEGAGASGERARGDEAAAPAREAGGARAERAGEAQAEPRAEAAQKMGPAVRKLLDEHDLDAASIKGSGRDGRITKTDVLEHLNRNRESDVGSGDTEQPRAPAAAESGRAEQRVPMTRLRARIAERLVDAQATAAMLTTFNEVDMSAVMALRKRYQESFQARHEIKLGFMSFFVRAVIEALREFPVLNASIDDKEIVYHEYFDIGVAVSTERGLVVPVMRDADRLGFGDIEKAIRDFGERAQNNALNMDDLTGGTFTITNGGIFGSMMSTPIINPPQSGILGMHTIQERPVVVDGQIEARPMMYLALTYDHRIVDGREAVQFLVRVKERIEDPARLILQV